MASFFEAMKKLEDKNTKAREELAIRLGAYVDRVMGMDPATMSYSDLLSLRMERDKLIDAANELGKPSSAS